MNTVIIEGKTYKSINAFMLENQIKTRKTVYDWVDSGKAEKKKIMNSVFFALK